MNRKCKRCGEIDTGIWNTIALIGYSLMVGALGYALASIFYFQSIVIMGVVFGMILFLPLTFIHYHEERKAKENDKE